MHPQRRLFWFRRLALAGALLAACVVVLGAWVRLTDAGLGCPDWPGCYGHAYPAAAHAPQSAGFQFAKAWHEMIHRYFASSLVVIIAILFVWAVRFRADRGQPVIAALLLLPIVCVQAALGALTVTLMLKPLIVTSHLLGGLTTFAILWWLSITPATRELTEPEVRLRAFAWIGLTALIVQIALGGWTSSNYAAIACPDFPTCQNSWWPHADFHDAFILWRGLGINYEGGVLDNPARIAVHLTHRLGALVAALTLSMAALLVLTRPALSGLRGAAVGVFAALGLQLVIGISMVEKGFPLWLATAHTAGAALLLLSVLNLLRNLGLTASGRPI
jgi:heme a synthase